MAQKTPTTAKLAADRKIAIVGNMRDLLCWCGRKTGGTAGSKIGASSVPTTTSASAADLAAEICRLLRAETIDSRRAVRQTLRPDLRAKARGEWRTPVDYNIP
jgi:dihydrodipicolinate synthase/N-acetylneuraminate lyase